MARIRTIKPEFFTSEDVVSLSPFARLLYVALWCEADRQGRMKWAPKTFKMRYFPADEFDIQCLCSELVDSGLVQLYGDGLAFIPTFQRHQHINPRESASTFPDPNIDASSRVSTRECTVTDAQVGRERKGKEGASSSTGHKGSRLSSDFQMPPDWILWATDNRKDLTPEGIRREADKFKDYWCAKAGAGGVKLDWLATWRNWIRESKPSHAPAPIQTSSQRPFI